MNLLFYVNWLCPKSPDVRHLGSDYDKVSSVEVKEPAARITVCAVLFYSVVFFPTFFFEAFHFLFEYLFNFGQLPSVCMTSDWQGKWNMAVSAVYQP